MFYKRICLTVVGIATWENIIFGGESGNYTVTASDSDGNLYTRSYSGYRPEMRQKDQCISWFVW